MRMSASRPTLFPECERSPSSGLHTFHLNRAGCTSGLIDVKFTISHFEFRTRHWQMGRSVSPRLPLIREAKSLIEHAIYHKHGQKNDDVIKRAVSRVCDEREDNRDKHGLLSHEFPVFVLFVTVFPDFPHRV